MKQRKTVCAWCGRELSGPTSGSGAAGAMPWCDRAECRDRAARYFRFARVGLPACLFLIFVSAGLLLAPELGLGENRWFQIAGMLLMGVTLFALPFLFGGAAERWGARRAVWICRILGILVAAASLLLL